MWSKKNFWLLCYLGGAKSVGLSRKILVPAVAKKFWLEGIEYIEGPIFFERQT